LVLEGEQNWTLSKDGKDMWSGSVQAGALLYLPAGTSFHCRATNNTTCLNVMMSHESAFNNWNETIKAAFALAIDSRPLEKTPFNPMDDKFEEKLKRKMEAVTESITTEILTAAACGQKQKFMAMRQAP